MTELLDFINARLAEDEQTARKAFTRMPGKEHTAHWTADFSVGMQVRNGEGNLVVGHSWPNEIAHIERFNPRRALDDVEAKRELLRLHTPHENRDGDIECPTCVYTGTDEDAGGNRFRYREHDEWPCQTVRAVALAYQRHEDYRAEWRWWNENAMTANDPEPPPGSIVDDATGVQWLRSTGGEYWLRLDDLDGDPESWTKVAGNYGPVKLKRRQA
ncbi:DUF6221 family protein [Lentzea sp. NPDC102401]|uniref:DUF6221 family protein n=1 Tax=Lentzea sp. NPDC102401 TaxID=3364128 RepID=UPI0037FBF3D6